MIPSRLSSQLQFTLISYTVTHALSLSQAAYDLGRLDLNDGNWDKNNAHLTCGIPHLPQHPRFTSCFSKYENIMFLSKLIIRIMLNTIITINNVFTISLINLHSRVTHM